MKHEDRQTSVLVMCVKQLLHREHDMKLAHQQSRKCWLCRSDTLATRTTLANSRKLMSLSSYHQQYQSRVGSVVSLFQPELQYCCLFRQLHWLLDSHDLHCVKGTGVIYSLTSNTTYYLIYLVSKGRNSNTQNGAQDRKVW